MSVVVHNEMKLSRCDHMECQEWPWTPVERLEGLQAPCTTPFSSFECRTIAIHANRTSETDAGRGWEVEDESKLRYDNGATLVQTLNYLWLVSPQWLETNVVVKIRGDDTLITLLQFTQSFESITSQTVLHKDNHRQHWTSTSFTPICNWCLPIS